jgi:hypothetical protein
MPIVHLLNGIYDLEREMKDGLLAIIVLIGSLILVLIGEKLIASAERESRHRAERCRYRRGRAW